jgi:cobalt-zinc-cadmium efflux system membrane fusion protein
VLLCLFVSCNNTPDSEKAVAFSMSKAMKARCKFVTSSLVDLKNEIRLFGKIEADNNKVAHVFSVVGGLVTSINVGLGDYVKQGQLLATIQSSQAAEYEQEHLDAIGEIAIAEKNLQVQRDLFAGKLNSEKEVKLAEIELQKAQANLGRINEIINIYNFKKGSIFPLIAPMDGFIVSKKININELLLDSETEPLFSIANIDEIWAVAFVSESNISKIKEGYNASIKTLAFPDQEYHGTIEKIYNIIDPATKAMKIRIRIPNKDYKLKPDMNCIVNVSYSDHQKMVAIPSSAIIFDKSKYWVMVYKNDNNIKVRKVDIYRQLGDTSYINNGLYPGETVISKNGLLIYDAIND